jgi:hypothetical protein
MLLCHTHSQADSASSILVTRSTNAQVSAVEREIADLAGTDYGQLGH